MGRPGLLAPRRQGERSPDSGCRWRLRRKWAGDLSGRAANVILGHPPQSSRHNHCGTRASAPRFAPPHPPWVRLGSLAPLGRPLGNSPGSFRLGIAPLPDGGALRLAKPSPRWVCLNCVGFLACPWPYRARNGPGGTPDLPPDRTLARRRGVELARTLRAESRRPREGYKLRQVRVLGAFGERNCTVKAASGSQNEAARAALRENASGKRQNTAFSWLKTRSAPHLGSATGIYLGLD